jgi:hypothetical protein
LDPIQCFNDLISAFIAQEWEEARTHALDLLDWLGKGGFFSLDRADTQGFCRIIERLCRSHIERERMRT